MGKKRRSQEKKTGDHPFNIDPIIINWDYEVSYRHSYAQDSPFFAGLSKGQLMGSACTQCAMKFATPRSHCMICGAKTDWMALPLHGKVHTFTTCYFGGESFLKETPYTLIMVEFENVDTLFLSRLIGVKPEGVQIGMAVEAKFSATGQYLATDVYFVPRETGHDRLSPH